MSLTPRIDNIDAKAVKNLIINGGMDFWQRGNSNSVGSSYLYVADRFRLEGAGSGASVAMSKQTDSPDSNIFPYSSQIVIVNGVSAISGCISQAIESNFIKDMSGKNLVFSFWIKSSDTNLGDIFLRITRPSTGDDDYSGNSGGRMCVGTAIEGGQADITSQVTSDWQKITYKFQCPDFSTGNIGLALSLYMTTVDSPLGSESFFTTGWMLYEDTGQDIDVPFQRAGRNYAEELQLCERYYQKIFSQGYQYFFGGTAYCAENLRVPMRTTPMLDYTVDFSTNFNITSTFVNETLFQFNNVPTTSSAYTRWRLSINLDAEL